MPSNSMLKSDTAFLTPGPDPIKLFLASNYATLKFQPIRAVT